MLSVTVASFCHNTTKSEQTVFMLNATLQLGTGIVVAFAIIVALLAFNWFVSITSILLFGACYLFLSLIVRKKLDLNSVGCSCF